MADASNGRHFRRIKQNYPQTPDSHPSGVTVYYSRVIAHARPMSLSFAIIIYVAELSMVACIQATSIAANKFKNYSLGINE